MMKFRTLLNRLRRVITAERLIWSAALLVTAIAFLELGRSHPYPALYAPTDSLVIRDAAGQESTADLPAAPPFRGPMQPERRLYRRLWW